MAQARVKRTELKAPTIDDPERTVVQVEYQVGELPPRFLIIAKKEWTKEFEAERIRKDIKAREAAKEETVEL